MSANARPRYRQLADLLRAEITSGALKAGDALPTEMDLCEIHGVSRHTAREALRILSDDGLIERRRGAGTIVARPGAPAFAQPIGDYDAILQYARDAHFQVDREAEADEEALDRLGLTGRYRLFEGVRAVQSDPPQALARVYVRADLAPDADTINALPGPISEWLEAEHGIPVERVVQRMDAVALSREAAKRLGVPEGSAALRTVRRYRTDAGELILLSESLHPAGRFAYEVKLERKR